MEGGGIELDRVFFHHDRVANVCHDCGLEVFLVNLKFDDTQVYHSVTKEPLFSKWFISKHFHMEYIIPERNFLQFGFSLSVCEGEIADGSVFGRDDIEGSESDRLVGE